MIVSHQIEADLACRQDKAFIRDLYKEVRHLPYVKEVCDALPHVVMILNSNHQIVFVNRKLLDLASRPAADDCLGFRPGELFDCINAESGPSGCGTSENCRVCGALQALFESRRGGRTSTREFRLTARIDGDAVAFDFRLSAAPFSFERQPLTIVHLIVNRSHSGR